MLAALSLTSCKKESKGSDVVDIYTPYINDFTCRYYTMSGEKIEDKETYFAHDAEIRVKIDFTISSEAYKAGKNKFTVAFVLPTGFTGRIVSANTSTTSNRYLSATFATGDKSKNCSVEAVIVFNYVSGRLRFGCSYDDETQREDGGEPLNCAEPFKFTKYGSVYQVDREGHWGYKVESLDIPQTFDGYPVTMIGDYAFSNFKELKRITIPLGISYIGAGAFYGCSSLESAIIPDSVTGIGYRAFDNCDSLKFNEYNNAFYLGDDANPHLAFIKSNNTTHVDIPDTTRVICGGAFKDRSDIHSVTIGKGITVIPYSAFSGCRNLASVTIGNGVTNIWDEAFNGCRGLTNVTIPNSVRYIGESVFKDCVGLTTVIIEKGVKSIDASAFEGCVGLTSIIIPDSVTIIGESAFSGCVNLASVTIGNGVTYIRVKAFNGCSSLTSISLPDSVIYLEDFAFGGCENLKSVTLSKGLMHIGAYAFSKCGNLTSIAVPDGVRSIGNYAFSGCSGLTNIVIPGSVTSIGDMAFVGCRSLTNLSVSDDNAVYKSIDGNLYTKNGETLEQYAIGKSDTQFTIPDGVTYIGPKAFSLCNSLTSVSIPDGVIRIYGEAFRECNGLTNIVIPGSVTTIDSMVFVGCRSLTNFSVSNDNAVYKSIDGNLYSKDGTKLIQYAVGKSDSEFTLPGGVTSIGSYAFGYCSSLTAVTLPDSVTTIENVAFRGCENLTSVIMGRGVKKVERGAFSDCNKLATVKFYGTKSKWFTAAQYAGSVFNDSQTTVKCSDGDLKFKFS